ncbi:MAG TPA: CvpA family protein [Planctomycetota bacterium]|nr:CvpA family protein [Planctomycetota bacterium]
MDRESAGMLLDAAIVGFLLLQTFLGWRRGLLWQAAGVASIGFGVVLGLALAPSIGARLLDHVTSDPFKAKLIAFLFILGMTGFLLRMAAALAEVQSERGLPPEEKKLRRADDRILGGIFGALKGSVLTLVIIAAAVTFYPANPIWHDSTLARPLAIAGSRLLPEGAVKEVKRWATRSAGDVSKGLDIQPNSVAVPKEEKEVK